MMMLMVMMMMTINLQNCMMVNSLQPSQKDENAMGVIFCHKNLEQNYEIANRSINE